MGKSYLLIILVTIAGSYTWKLRLPRDILHSNRIDVRDVGVVAPKASNGAPMEAPKTGAAAAGDTPKTANSGNVLNVNNNLEPRIIPGRVTGDVGQPDLTRRWNPNPSLSQRTQEPVTDTSNGLLTGLLDSGRRNMEALKSIPVLGSADSELVRKRSIKTSDVPVADLTDLFNRTSALAKDLNDEYNSLALSEKDNQDPLKYAISVLQYFNLQLFRNYYNNSTNLVDAIEKSLEDVLSVRNNTALQFAAPVVRAGDVFRGIISLPLEIVRTACASDVLNDECVFNYVRMLTSLNQNDPCNSSRLAKGRIFELALKVHFNKTNSKFINYSSEIYKNIVTKAKEEISGVRRKRAIPKVNVPAGNSNAGEVNSEAKIVKIRNVPSGNLLPNNAQTKAAVNVQPGNTVANNVPVLSSNVKLTNVSSVVQPIIAPNAVPNLQTNNVQLNPLLNIVGAVNLGQNAAVDVNPKSAVSSSPVDSNSISPRRSDGIEAILASLFDYIVSELKKLNAEALDGPYEVYKAIVHTQKSGIPLCSTLHADRILDDPYFVSNRQ